MWVLLRDYGDGCTYQFNDIFICMWMNEPSFEDVANAVNKYLSFQNDEKQSIIEELFTSHEVNYSDCDSLRIVKVDVEENENE